MSPIILLLDSLLTLEVINKMYKKDSLPVPHECRAFPKIIEPSKSYLGFGIFNE